MFVPKENGTLRFCVDYWKQNAVTERHSSPIPRIDACIDSLGDASIFLPLHANRCYRRVEIEDADWDKTEFTSPQGPYQFSQMPLGVCSALETFQRTMEVFLSAVKWHFDLVYPDDIIIFSRTVDEHSEHVKILLSLLHKGSVMLNLKKCKLCTGKINYLGHVIRPGRQNLLFILRMHYKTYHTVDK